MWISDFVGDKKMCNKILIGVIISVILSINMVYASPQTIESYGEYMLSPSDTLDTAKEKALQEALRNAVEQAGVYVESYSNVNDMSLTKDQIRVLAGSIVKVNNKKFTNEVSGNTFIIKCTVDAVIDIDSIDLQRVMEMKKTQEANVELTKTVADLQYESETLRQKYQQAQSESEKLKIKNNLLLTEKELGVIYKNDYKGKTVIEELNDVTSDFSNFGKLYPGMPDSEFSSQIEEQLINKGYTRRIFPAGKEFTRVIDNEFTERLIYDYVNNQNLVFFETKSDALADKIFKIAFANLYSNNGNPTYVKLDATSNAIWEKELEPGKKYITQIYKTYDGTKYWLRISKSVHNSNTVKHTKFSIEDTLRNLNPINGDWYNDQGRKELSIHDGYINGCKVVEGFDFVGGRGAKGVYRIIEDVGPRDITIEKLTDKMIKVDNNVILRNAPSQLFYESVNGIYLGMPDSDVISKIGKPDIIKNNNRIIWEYKNIGLSIMFESGAVISITMKNNGKWFLDRSKLNYRNPIEDYVKAYKFKNTPKPLTLEQRKKGYIGGAYSIVKGEYLWFDYYPESLTLSIFWN